MPDIQITVRDKKAQVFGKPVIVCGNSDYTVTFDFDSDWNDCGNKTARFFCISSGVPQYYDVIFSGSTVSIPAVYNTCELDIGVYAGNIRTTTPAAVPCQPCITDGQPVHPDPPPDIYLQLLELLEGMQGRSKTVHAMAIGNAFFSGFVTNTEPVEEES